MAKRYFFSILLIVALSAVSNAQDGSIDPTFNPSDTGYANGTDQSIKSISLQTDGKIILGGNFRHYNTVPKNGIVRIHADESLDATFDIGSGAVGSVTTTAIQPDGKIVVAGEFSSFNGVSKGNLVRLNTNGSLDATFNATGSGFGSGIVEKIVLQPDGKILATGWFSTYNGESVPNLVRLNPDGTLDFSFNATAAYGQDFIFDMVVDANGKIIVVGGINITTDSSKRCIARFNADGSLDANFSPIHQGSLLYAIALQSDGKICVGGYSYYEGGTSFPKVTRYDPDGSIDGLFGSTGLDSLVQEIVIQPDGKILALGDESVRFNPDGTIDTGFASSVGFQNEIYTAAFTPENKLLIAGGFLTYGNYSENFITRVNYDGTRDTSFDLGNGTGADNIVSSIAAQTDGKLIISGHFDHYNGVARRRVARLDGNGLLDATFNPGSGLDGYVSFSKVLSDGKIIIAGDFTQYDGQTANQVARLNPDGSLDTTFSSGNGFTFEVFGFIEAFDVQPGGKVLIGGRFDSYNGSACQTMVRLNADGSLDNTFTTNFLSAPDQEIHKILALDNQRVLIAMSNSTLGQQNTLVRTDAFGNPDATFQPLTQDTLRDIENLAVEQNGSILVSGYVPTWETPTYKFLRVSENGDTTTVFGTSIYPIVQQIKPQADGKIIATLLYYSTDPAPQRSISRLNQDGSVDTTFNGPNDLLMINDLVAQQDNWVFVGNFTSVDGLGRNRIARFESSGALAVPENVSAATDVKAVKSGSDIFVRSESEQIASVAVYDLNGRKLASENKLSATFVHLKTKASNQVLIVKTILENGSVHTRKLF